MNADLLGKLRALESRYNATVDDYDGNQSAVNYAHQCAAHDLADLLPAVIAQIESDAKDGERLDYISSMARCSPDIDGNHIWWPNTFNQNVRGPNLRAAIDRAIDAAKERT